MIDKVRSGKLGDVFLFTSTFAQMLDPAGHRAKSGDDAGPVLDMGPYPVNAARYVFGAEPTEVASAVGLRRRPGELGDFDDTVAVTLRFPEDRIAQFALSYAANFIDSYTVVGTKGSIEMSPGFIYGKPLEQVSTIGESRSRHSFKNTDHFGGEMKYFSDCILNEREPEPDAEEGFADVRVLEGVLEALRTGKPVVLPPFTRTKRIDTESQEQRLRAKSSPDLVNTSNPGKDTEKQPKN